MPSSGEWESVVESVYYRSCLCCMLVVNIITCTTVTINILLYTTDYYYIQTTISNTSNDTNNSFHTVLKSAGNGVRILARQMSTVKRVVSCLLAVLVPTAGVVRPVRMWVEMCLFKCYILYDCYYTIYQYIIIVVVVVEVL